MELPTITNDAFSKLKCSLCKNCLSYFPIYISLDKKNVCGRCANSLPPEKCIENEVFETIIQFMQFPCRYKQMGCQEKLIPEQIPSHEKNCEFRVIKCPTKHFTQCEWEGDMASTLNHCQDKHFDLILKHGKFELDLSHSYQTENILEHNSVIFLVNQKFYAINKLMEFAVYSHQHEIQPIQRSCEVNFKTNNRNLVVQCSTTSFEQKKVIEIFLDSLKSRDNNSTTVQVAIDIEKLPSNDASATIKEVNEELLTKFKCSTCQEYALPPIFQKSATDAFGLLVTIAIQCGSCKDKQNTSQSTKTENNAFGFSVPKPPRISPMIPNTFNNSKEVQNLTLDEIANSLNYPCKHRKNGCTFIAKPGQMRVHQQFCPFGTHNCPVHEYTNCIWHGSGISMRSHVKAAHDKMFVNAPVTERLLMETKEPSTFSTSTSKPCALSRCYLIQFASHLFRLNFATMDQNYHWVVEEIGCAQSDFMFELEIIDTGNKRASLISRQPCTTLKKKAEIFQSKSCHFHKDQISRFLSDDSITFNVQVYK